MTLEWDPFGVPEEEDILAPENRVAPPAEDKDKRLIRFTDEDIEAVYQALSGRMRDEKPWKHRKAAELDYLWHTPTCDLYDWQHHDLKVEIGNGIIYIINNRPNENNTMQDTLSHGMQDAVMGCLIHKDKLRVVVFTGEGRMYSAGGDPKMWQHAAKGSQADPMAGDGTVGIRIPRKPYTPEVNEHLVELARKGEKAGAFPPGQGDIGRIAGAKQMFTMANLPEFTIMLQNGSAMGGGVGWVCCCDYIISLKKAYMVLSEVKIGVIPATISPYVVQKMGVTQSKRFFCCAENLTAARAMECGIVDEVVDNMREGHERVKRLCEKISVCGPRGVEIAKGACAGVSGWPLGETLAFYTAALESRCRAGAEAKEGSDCLKAGAEPSWQQTMIGFDEGKWPTVGVGQGKGKKSADE